MQPFARRWIHIALVYFVVAVTLGCFMGATENFTFMPVHAHLNLLGWVSMTLMGLLYHHFPNAANNKLATVHFWGYQLLLPPMMVLLVIDLGGHPEVGPVLGMLSIALLAIIVTFAVNIWKNSCTDQK